MMLTIEESTAVALVATVIAGAGLFQHLRERVATHQEWLKRNDEEHRAMMTENREDHGEIKAQLSRLVDAVINGKVKPPMSDEAEW